MFDEQKKLVAAANDVDEVVLKKTEPGKKRAREKKVEPTNERHLDLFWIAAKVKIFPHCVVATLDPQ